MITKGGERRYMMDKNKNGSKALFLFLVFTVVVSSIAYAAVSSFLEVKGTARIENYKWNVHFDNLENAKIEGEMVENKKPAMNEYKTIISGFDVTFNKPSDKVVYEFDIVNEGDLDAYISSIIVNTPKCKSKSQNLENEKEFCDNLKYSVVYKDGTSVKVNDTLNKKTSKKAQLVLEYKGDHFPTDEIETNNLSVTIGYSQK